jgi:hypothetical protein
LVAWVVECAMNTTSAAVMPAAPSARRKASITPSATPASAPCVVGTTTWPMISWLSLSSSTALVKVPPTSMPMRTSRPTGCESYWVNIEPNMK